MFLSDYVCHSLFDAYLIRAKVWFFFEKPIIVLKKSILRNLNNAKYNQVLSKTSNQLDLQPFLLPDWKVQTKFHNDF